MAHRGLLCYGCHNLRNKMKAAVKKVLTDFELEQEMLRNHELLVKTGHAVNIKREKIIGWLCKKCSIKATNAVKERPFGMGWREAFNFRNDPKYVQAWKDQRLEMEIGK
jgi:hypothetical protein